MDRLWLGTGTDRRRLLWRTVVPPDARLARVGHWQAAATGRTGDVLVPGLDVRQAERRGRPRRQDPDSARCTSAGNAAAIVLGDDEHHRRRHAPDQLGPADAR